MDKYRQLADKYPKVLKFILLKFVSDLKMLYI